MSILNQNQNNQQGGQGEQGRVTSPINTQGQLIGAQGRNDQGQGQGQGQGQRNINIGETLHVWKLTGVRNLKDGPQTSEKIGGEFPDVSPDEPLVVVKRYGGKLLCRRGDGSEILVHRNHVNPNAKYYATRKGTGQGGQQGSPGQGGQQIEQQMDPQARLQHARQKLEEANREYDRVRQMIESNVNDTGQDQGQRQAG